jgi:hypothetical protein
MRISATHMLAEFQRQFVRSILDMSDSQRFPPEIDRIGQQRMAIHRTTVFMALTNALEMSYPSVASLVGKERFTALAHDFVAHSPPRSAVLYDFGANFPEHLKARANPADHPALVDLASFDWNIDMAGHRPVNVFGPLIPVSTTVGLRLDSSLSCLSVNYAVDALREALGEASNAGERSDLPANAEECSFIFWRATDGVRVKRIAKPSYWFASSLLAGDSAADALARALSSSTAQGPLRDIQRELFGTLFCQVVNTQQERR